MLAKLIRFSLNNRPWVLGAFGVLVVLGAKSLSELPIDAVPDITNIQVVVNTKTGALDPEKIELLATRPIEIEMGGLPRVDEMRSISKYGLSQITLAFKDGTDVYWARQQVSERLQNVRGKLPTGLSPELAPITTGLGEVFMYSVEAKPGSALAATPANARLTELRTVQDFTIAPQLKRVHGVAEVDSNGGFQKQIHVNFYPKKLEEVGLTPEALVQRLETLGENYGGGYIERDGRQVVVRSVPGIPDLKALEAFPLGLDARGGSIRLSRVASVRIEHPLRVGAATRNGEETVLGTVLMRVGANSRQVANDVDAAIRAIKLPDDVTIVPLYSRSFLVNATIRTVAKSLLEGALLVVLVLVLMLGNLRASLMVAAAIPVSMLMAAKGMEIFGVSANLMSLGAIDFGLLVDGSVVLVENIVSRIQRTGEATRQVIEEASTEVIAPVVSGLLLIMAVYVPVLTLEAIEGKMFRPMATTVLLALGASLLVAVFVMPVLADVFLTGKTRSKAGHEAHETWFFRGASRLYQPLLRYCLAKPTVPVLVALFAGAVAAVLLARSGANFIPKLDEGDLVITLARDPKQSLQASVADQKKVEVAARTFPEVTEVFSRLGTPESATDPMGVYLADTFLVLEKDRGKWRYPTKDALFNALKAKLESVVPEQEASATQPIEMRFNEMLEGSRADVTLRVLGPDLSQLVTLIERSKKVLSTVPGIESIESDPLTALKKSEMLDVRPDYDSIARYGLTVASVNRLLELAMSGKEVGSYFENALRFPIVVHLDESLRERSDVIAALPVSLPQGGTLPLAKVASLDTQERVTTIARSWGERYAAASINLGERDVSSFVREAQAVAERDVPLPEGYRFYWGGQFRNLNRARIRLAIIVPLTLLAVFLVLLRGLGNVRSALLVFATVPFAGVGGILALSLRGIPLSISAAVGFIALIGIALLNALVLINVFQRRESSTESLAAHLEACARSRLRPVLMTAMVASLGFVPMALNTGIGAEVQRPLATVVIGGLVTSTLLTLLLLPPLYRWVEERRA